MMSAKQLMIEGLKKNGFEVSEVGNTIQYTNRAGRTVVTWFDENDRPVKCEEWG